MPTVTVPRADVTVEQVGAVLRRELGSRYKVMPSLMAAAFGEEGPGDATTIPVASNWLERANVRVVSDGDSTGIRVSPGATYFALIRLLRRAGLAHKCTGRWGRARTWRGRLRDRKSSALADNHHLELPVWLARAAECPRGTPNMHLWMSMQFQRIPMRAL